MKNIKRIFKKNVNFVKPLYRKVRPCNRVKNKRDGFNSMGVDSTYKLCGNGIHVKSEIFSDEGIDYNFVTIKHKNIINEHNNYLPNSVYDKPFSVSTKVNSKKALKSLRLKGDTNGNNDAVNRRSVQDRNMLGIVESCKFHANKEIEEEDDTSKNNPTIVHKVPDTWLRVYPDSKGQNETICSVIFRCAVCQIGLVSFLVIWTMLWVFVIHSIEGPYEAQVSVDFEDQQNQLIIDLATELRQITPVSPKWRQAIENRIEEERRLTISAVAKGARLHPGQYWDVPGTFLFAIYVMTALGFGAQVPQTFLGRTSTLIYAALSVPAHVYLMVNASTCVVVHVENCFRRVRLLLNEKVPFVLGKTALENNRESTNCNTNLELMKSSSNIRKYILRLAGVLCAGRGVPLATLAYYACGALAFGAARSKPPLEALMFPLEFTTTGGLENVASHVRILYGAYVEGGMWLVACALATLRRHSGAARARTSRRYRLYVGEPGAHCAGDVRAPPPPPSR